MIIGAQNANQANPQSNNVRVMNACDLSNETTLICFVKCHENLSKFLLQPHAFDANKRKSQVCTVNLKF